MTRPLLVALQFLTIIPVTFNRPPDAKELGGSALYYPIVGLLIGLLLIGCAYLTNIYNDPLAAIVVVSTWIILTGGLHLDGLADSIDGWTGGMGSRERTLEIMRDPHIGAMGVIGLILLILLKTAALQQLLSHGDYIWLLLPPVIGRTMSLLLLSTTTYIRPDGIGRELADNLSAKKIWVMCAAIALLLIIMKPLFAVILLCACAALIFGWRWLLLRRLGGCTGDTLGAMIECSEVLTLLLLPMVWI